jgi:excisionase family DNA binding protein
MFFMNRRLVKQELIDLNELSPEEAALVFAILKPLQGEGDQALFLESDADALIAQLRKVRPSDSCPLSKWIEEDDEVIEQNVGDRNSWAASVEPAGGKPFRKPPPLLLVDEEQAARMLGVSRRTIFDLNKQGTLPSVMVGSRKKYSVKMLRGFADRGEF